MGATVESFHLDAVEHAKSPCCWAALGGVLLLGRKWAPSAVVVATGPLLSCVILNPLA